MHDRRSVASVSTALGQPSFSQYTHSPRNSKRQSPGGTMTSAGAGSCPFSAPITVPIVRSALNAGITTE